MTDRVVLRQMTEADWPQVAAIWAEGIATGNATFETEPPSWSAFDATRRGGGGPGVGAGGGAPRGGARGGRGRLGCVVAGVRQAVLFGCGREQRVRHIGGSRPGRRK